MLGLPSLNRLERLTYRAVTCAPVWVLLMATIVRPPPFRQSDDGKQLPRIAQEMLAAHNSVRARHGVPPLRWSDELAKYAQKWAHTLIARGEFSHHRNLQYGENLFEVSGGSATADEVVSGWAAEAKKYNYRNNTCSGRCGHYTQIVWRDTKMVGCGMARDRGREVWVCNYEPAGNIMGERPY